MADRLQPYPARCSDCSWRHRPDDLCIVDLGEPESLDAPLTDAERQECERVVRAETWRIGGGNPRRASDGAPLVAVLAGDADAIDAHCRFVCWTDPEDAARIVAAVNGDALRAVERDRDALAEALQAAKIPHLRVDGDPWFSCPIAHAEDSDETTPTSCFRCDGRPCNHIRCECGADEHNARIDTALAASTARDDPS